EGSAAALVEHREDVLEVGGRALTALVEHAEDVLEPAAGSGTARREAGPRTHGADLVVFLALILVAEDGVGLADLLGLRLGGRITRVRVGVILARELAIGLLQIGVGDVLGYSERLVE